MKELKIGELTASVPIVQGGMGVGVSLSGLASAVANEGAIGVISAAGLGVIHHGLSDDVKEANQLGLRYEIRRARTLTKGIIGVNIMVALTDFNELARVAIQEGADIIFAGAGLPLSLPSLLTPGCHTKLVPIVSSARAAKLICTKWWQQYNYLPDAVVVEGPMAGGHLGFKREQIDDEEYSLDAIVPQVVTEVRRFAAIHGAEIPVIAGGGIFSGEDIHRIMSLGADAVQMGTRFVVTEECDASPLFKQNYIDAAQEDIAIIQSPVGMLGRAVKGLFLEKVARGECKPRKCPYNCIKTCNVTDSPYCIMMALYNAYKGRMQHGYSFCGSNAWRCEKIVSVGELIDTLKREYDVAANTHAL